MISFSIRVLTKECVGGGRRVLEYKGGLHLEVRYALDLYIVL